MKIKMLVGISGIDFALSPGDETERFSDDECGRMIDADMAVPVAPKAKVEKAVPKPVTETR